MVIPPVTYVTNVNNVNNATSVTSPSTTPADSCPESEGEKEDSPWRKGDAEFAWDEATQGLVLSSFFWGYVVTHVPAGVIAERAGAKYTLMIAVLVPALCTLATPWAARWGRAWGLVGLRVLKGGGQGFLWPSVVNLQVKWITREERARISSLVYCGAMFGNGLSLAVSGLLLTVTTWEVVFYIYGGLALLWCCLWQFCGYSKPADHPGLSEQERLYLENYWREVNMTNESPPTPWRHMVKSGPLWGVVAAQMGFDWGFFTLITDLPKYLRTVLHFSIAQTGLWSAAVYVATSVGSVVAGSIADRLLAKGCISVTNSRKMFNVIAYMGTAVAMVATTLAACDRQLATLSVVLGMAMMGGHACSALVNYMDLAPNYAGTLMAVSNGIGSLSGIISPYLTGLLVPQNQLSQWRKVFLISAAVLATTSLVYITIGSGKPQYWNSLPVQDGLKLENKNKKTVLATVDGIDASAGDGFRKAGTEVA